MAYQKLQVGRVWGPVIQNNNVDIPDISTVAIDPSDPATLTGVSSGVLTVTNLDFFNIGVKVGMIAVKVDTDGKPDGVKGNIVAIKDDTITVEDGTFTTGDTIAIFGPPSPQNGCVLYIGGDEAGVVDVSVETVAGDVALFKSVSIGSFLPVQVKRLRTETSEGANVLALW